MKIVRISILYIMFLLVYFLDSQDMLASYIVDNEEVILDKITIMPSSLILEIFKDLRTECETSDSCRVFSLLIKDCELGEKVYIVQETDHKVNLYENILGYALIDKDTVILYGKQPSDFLFSKKPAPTHFHIKDYLRNDSKEWLYLINDGIFARDGESMGWIWHIPSDRLKDYEFTKFAITAPKRTKK